MKKRFVIATMACAMLLAGCGNASESKNADNKTDSSVKTEAQENTKEKNTKEEYKKVELKIDKENKELVYTAFEDKEYGYNLPYINIDSEDVKKINDEIASIYVPIMEEQLNLGGSSVDLFSVEYNFYVNDNILSLCIKDAWPNDQHNYDIYNVDINTGKRLDSKAIIAAKNKTESEFLGKVKEKCINDFLERYGDRESNVNNYTNNADSEEEKEKRIKEYDDIWNKTNADENYTTDLPMYLDYNNNICVIARVFSFAEQNGYDVVMKFDE